MESWPRMNPKFAYWFWGDVECSEFGFVNSAQIGKQNEWCGKADIMRYEILNRFGGIYIDADSECLVPLPDSMLDHTAFAAFESEIHAPGKIANGYIGTVANSQLMKRCVEECRRYGDRLPAVQSVGTGMFTRAVTENMTGVHIYPSQHFMPFHFSSIGNGRTGRTAEPLAPYDGPVYAQQYWGSTLNSYRLLAKL